MKSDSPTPLCNFVDLLMDAVFAVDADARVVFASASCERIFGYTPNEMVGKNMFDMMLPEDQERTRDSVGDVMSGREPLYPQGWASRPHHVVSPLVTGRSVADWRCA